MNKIANPTAALRMKIKMRDFFSNPANIILVITVVVLGFFTLYPLVLLIGNTVKVNIADIMYPELFGKKVGDITGFHWKRMLTSEMSSIYFWNPLKNAVLMSLLASFIAILYGGIVAFLITRTDIKAKKFVSSVFIFPYMMPSWTIATFWKNFFQNPDIGNYQSGMLYWLTGIKVPEKMVYGLVPCAIVLGLHYAPFAYILIGGILRNMDANLEEAATILKTSRARIIRKITLPIVLPALLSTFLLVFSSSMSAYAVPQFLGGASNNKDADITLLIDLSSSSMQYKSEIEAAVRELASAMNEKGTLRVVSAGNIPVTEYVGNPSGAVDFTLPALKNESSKTVAVDLALRLASNDLINAAKKRSIIMISDGNVKASAFQRYNLTELTEFMNNNAIGFSYVQLTQSAISNELQYILDNTSGNDYYIYRAEGLKSVIGDIIDLPQGIYQLSYTSSLKNCFGEDYLPIEAEVYLLNRSGRDESGYFAPLQ